MADRSRIDWRDSTHHRHQPAQGTVVADLVTAAALRRRAGVSGPAV